MTQPIHPTLQMHLMQKIREAIPAIRAEALTSQATRAEAPMLQTRAATRLGTQPTALLTAVNL